jgi:hypothetical protein
MANSDRSACQLNRLNRQASATFVPDVFVGVTVDGGVADAQRLEARADVLKDVGVDGERHVEGMRSRPPPPPMTFEPMV